MKNTFLYPEERIEKFYTYLSQALLIKTGYLLLIFVLQALKIYKAPDPVFIAVSLMALTSLIIGIWFEKFPARIETAVNILFIGTLFDLFLLTIILYYLSGIEFVYYAFYIILSFIVFSRPQAICITAWIVFLFLVLVALRYFQIIPTFPSTFPKEEQTFYSPDYVATNTMTIIVTLCFLGYFSYGFYKMMAKRVNLLRRTYHFLEDEKKSLEIRIEAREREINEEKKGLAQKIRERKQELEKERKKLEERVEELERFQKVARGREAKIIELEKELAKLQQKSSNPQRSKIKKFLNFY